MSKVTSTINIPQPNIFGRIGTGLGQGLAEQLPKEIERGRLASGINELANTPNLTQLQGLAGLVGAGAYNYPQLMQTAGELLKQQGMSNAIRRRATGESTGGQQTSNGLPQSYPPSQQVALQAGTNQTQPSIQGQGERPEGGVASISPTQAALNPYIPKTNDQLLQRAGQLQLEDPGLYPTFESAYQGAAKEDQQEQAISSAKQGQRLSEQNVESNIQNQIDRMQERANVKIPENVTQPIVRKAMDDVRLARKSELKAAQDAQNEMDKISREYDATSRLGKWSKPSEMRRAVNSLRDDFKQRNDLENFADKMVGESGFSNPIAYWKTFPVEEYPEIQKHLSQIKKAPIETYKRGLPDPLANERQVYDFAEKVAPLLSKSGASPLSIAQELKMKGLNPDHFLDYLVKNKRELNLNERQIRELGKTREWLPNLTDIIFLYGINEQRALE